MGGVVVPGPLPGKSKPRFRRRLSRTLSRARWREYERLLRIALAQEYEISGVEQWLGSEPSAPPRPLLVVRHDVDQHPQSALRMAAIEAEFGIASTWYFRWRTANSQVIGSIKDDGHAVGLHYETLTRLSLERATDPPEMGQLVLEARELLARELALFAELFGANRSACPHGDTRVPGVNNGVLLRDEDVKRYGIEWDANVATGQRGVDVWLSDRSSAEGRWQDYLDPVDLLVDRRSPILLVVHPNNWVSGVGLWWDRLLPGGIRTSSDQPPLLNNRIDRADNGAAAMSTASAAGS
jgi:hypothetical protein